MDPDPSGRRDRLPFRIVLCTRRLAGVDRALQPSQFWQQAIAAMWHPTLGAVLFLVSLFVVVVCCRHCCCCSCRRASDCASRPACCSWSPRLSSYFASAYGAVMNQDMMRNVIETDPAEVGGLISFDLLAPRRRCSASLPAVLVWRVRFPRQRGAHSCGSGWSSFGCRAGAVRGRAVRVLGELRSVLSRAQADPLHAESGAHR